MGYTELNKLTNEELKAKIEFGESAGGIHGMRLVKSCNDILNKRALEGLNETNSTSNSKGYDGSARDGKKQYCWNW